MNKRHKKKFINKLKMKKYINYRSAKIIRCVDSGISDADAKNTIIYIIDSRKMNLKHPKKITLFKNCYPISMI